MNEIPFRLRTLFLAASASLLAASGTPLHAAPEDLPLMSITDLVYEGGFRLPGGGFGESALSCEQGTIAYNPLNRSLYIVGYDQDQAIAEFPVPTLVKSEVLGELPMAGNPRQPFSRVLHRPTTGNPQQLNGILSMAVFPRSGGQELLANALQFYDAGSDNTHTTLAVRDAANLAGSQVDGYFALEGGPGHTTGWMSPIPSEWQSLLGGPFLAGQSSGYSIISRLSVGPSAFAFDPADIVDNPSPPNPVPTVKLMDFSLQNPLHGDLENASLTNDLWTHLSNVRFGMIVPGTRSYLTIGSSGGHESGVCYKRKGDNPQNPDEGCDYACGGYCSGDPADNSQYYWLWDVNDLLRVKRGELAAHQVRPYSKGRFATPFSNGGRRGIEGGSFDPETGLVYLTIGGEENFPNCPRPPVIIAYSFQTGMPPSPLLGRPRRLRIKA